MKITSILPFVLYASLATAKIKKPKLGGSGGSEETEAAAETDTAAETTADSASETSGLDVGAVISSFYPTQGVPTIAPSASTALATGLLAVESSWFESPEYTSANAAISSALPLSLSASVAISGYRYGEIMTDSWFTNSVPTDIQTAVVEYVSKIESVHYRYVPTATGAGSVATKVAGSGALKTAAPLQMAGLVGVVGGIFAAVM